MDQVWALIFKMTCRLLQVVLILVVIKDKEVKRLILSVMQEFSDGLSYLLGDETEKPVDQFHMTEYLLPHLLNM